VIVISRKLFTPLLVVICDFCHQFDVLCQFLVGTFDSSPSLLSDLCLAACRNFTSFSGFWCVCADACCVENNYALSRRIRAIEVRFPFFGLVWSMTSSPPPPFFLSFRGFDLSSVCHPTGSAVITKPQV
jgi:hypothetical protein